MTTNIRSIGQRGGTTAGQVNVGSAPRPSELRTIGPREQRAFAASDAAMSAMRVRQHNERVALVQEFEAKLIAARAADAAGDKGKARKK